MKLKINQKFNTCYVSYMQLWDIWKSTIYIVTEDDFRSFLGNNKIDSKEIASIWERLKVFVVKNIYIINITGAIVKNNCSRGITNLAHMVCCTKEFSNIVIV